jgi:hypothetical protein
MQDGAIFRLIDPNGPSGALLGSQIDVRDLAFRIAHYSSYGRRIQVITAITSD